MNKKDMSAQRRSTMFLRAAVIAMGLFTVFISSLILWETYNGWGQEFPDYENLKYAVVAGLSLAPLAFLVALGHVMRLLGLIDRNKVFSTAAVRALQAIKTCAFMMGGVLLTTMPLFYRAADEDDAPGLIIIAMAFVCAPIVGGVFLAVAQRLLQTAIDIKSENDLTV